MALGFWWVGVWVWWRRGRGGRGLVGVEDVGVGG